MSGPGDVQESERNSLRDRNRELATLLEVSKRLAATLQLDEVLQAATDGVTRLHALKTAAVYLGEGDVLRLSATTPPLPPEFPDDLRLVALADHPHLSEAIASGAPVFLPDAASAHLTAAEAAVTHLRGLRSILYLPLTAGVKLRGRAHRRLGGRAGEALARRDRLLPHPREPRGPGRPERAALRGRATDAADLERRIAERERTERACGRARRGCGSPSWRRSRASTTSTSRPARPS